MSSKTYQILSTFLFLYSGLVVSQDCPYPCNPPPIFGGGNSGGSGNTPPKAIFPPPSQTGVYPSPSTIFPYNPPNYYGGGQPPPDPVVPWFPYYYKKPPHSTDEPTSMGSRIHLRIVILVINVIVVTCCLC